MTYLSAQKCHQVKFSLNGTLVQGEVQPRLLLTDFLRQHIGSTGTHVGCEHGVCGACTIIVDDILTRACLMLAVQADGAELRTVEGLAPSSGTLGILQSAFKKHHALQCGFCTAGILMSVDHFLRNNLSPSENEVRDLLSGHLCRCTGYTPIVNAVREAAATIRGRPDLENANV